MCKLTGLITLLIPFFASVAMAIEEPRFEVLLETQEYEVRRYAPHIVAEVDVKGEFKEAGNEAFRVLAAYIFGANVPRKKMEMTAPVNSRNARSGNRMAMTAPVLSRDVDLDTYTYSFVMERKYTMDTLPEPTDPRVRLRIEEPRVMAVRRFSGRWTYENYKDNESSLLNALANDGIERKGEPILARYNSPFTLWFLRRNEVMIEVEWHE